MKNTLLNLGHSQIAYRSIGNGPDLLFLHGWPLHAETFRDLVPTLSKHFTCHLIDLPGAGASVWHDGDKIGLAEHAETVKAVVEAIGLKRYAMLAHDSGAVVARLVAAEHGDRVWALLFSNSEIPEHRPLWVEVMCWLARKPGSISLMRQFFARRWLRESALSFGGCFTDPQYIRGEFHELFIEPTVKDRRVCEGQAKLAENLDFSVVDALPAVHARITAPVFMIWGAQDKLYFPVEKAREMVDQFADARLVEIQNGKLFVHEDHPETFLGHALPFLREHAERLGGTRFLAQAPAY